MIVLWETSSERLTSIWHSASGWFFETASSRSSVLQEPRRFHHEWRVLKFFSRKFLLETLEFYTKNLWLPTWEALQATLVTLHDSLDNHVMRFSCKTCDRFDRPLNGEMVSDLRLPYEYAFECFWIPKHVQNNVLRNFRWSRVAIALHATGL